MAVKETFLRQISLVLLTVQNVSLILVMRYARTRSGDMFLASTAVVMSEVFKLISCFCLILIEEGCSVARLFSNLNKNIMQDWKDNLLIAVPALLYVLQNNLLFVAVSNLNAATFQVTYQLKLITTAIFFRVMLKRVLNYIQWASLFVLFVGVAIVQLQPMSYSSTKINVTEQNPLLGICAVFVASLMSGFSGVFFEKLLKGTDKSVWVRNVQLSSLGIVIGLITVLVNDFGPMREHGFFFGYDAVVWVVILLQSIGGLLVAAVLKYADNILKGFATSAAIVLSAVVSIYAFDFRLSWEFSLGASLVIVPTFVYAKFTTPSVQQDVPGYVQVPTSDPQKKEEAV